MPTTTIKTNAKTQTKNIFISKDKGDLLGFSLTSSTSNHFMNQGAEILIPKNLLFINALTAF